MRDRGKAFENAFRQSCENYADISIDRVNDSVTMYRGSDSICDFIVYRFPFECYVECKSHNGSSIPFSCLLPKKKKNQKQKNKYEKLLEKAPIPGVAAGYLIWLVDKDITFFLDVRDLEYAVSQGYKSIGYHSSRTFSFPEQTTFRSFEVSGKRKRVYYKYDMNEFFSKVGEIYESERNDPN